MTEEIGYPKPAPRIKPEDTRTFQQKYGNPIDRSKYKFNLKRTPLKQSSKPIRQQSAKQAKLLNSYEKGKVEKYENTPDVCESCGRNDLGISCSHIVPRSQSLALIDHPLNHCKQCFVCHDLTESMHYYQLNNGLKLMELLWDNLGGSGRQKFWKVFYAHDGLNQSMWTASRFYNPEIHC